MIYWAAKELEGKVTGIEPESFYMSLGALLRGINDDSLGGDQASRARYMLSIAILVVGLVFVTLLLLVGMRVKLREDSKRVDQGNTTPSDYTLWVQGIDLQGKTDCKSGTIKAKVLEEIGKLKVLMKTIKEDGREEVK